MTEAAGDGNTESLASYEIDQVDTEGNEIVVPVNEAPKTVVDHTEISLLSSSREEEFHSLAVDSIMTKKRGIMKIPTVVDNVQFPEGS